MKKTILLLLVILFTVKGYAQNAFYDAKRIYSWMKTNPADLRVNDTVAAIILKYSNGNSWKSLSPESELFKKMEELYRSRRYTKDESDLIIKEAITKSELDTSIKNAGKKWIDNLAKINNEFLEKEKALIAFLDKTGTADIQQMALAAEPELKQKINRLLNQEFDARGLTDSLQILKNIARSFAESVADSAQKIKFEKALTKEPQLGQKWIDYLLSGMENPSVALFTDSVCNRFYKRVWDARKEILSKEKEQKKSELEAVQKNLSEFIGSLTKKYPFLISDRNKIYLDNLLSSKSFGEAMRFENKEELVAANVQTSAALANFTMPGSTEIIDAMAIFLAKRVKQEAIIYFTDLIRTSIDAPILKNAFSNTAHMLEKWDGSTGPNFGAAWRYAFSKDLSQLPEKMISFCIDEKLVSTQEAMAFEDALAISLKVKNRYNFIEIVQHFSANEKSAVKSRVLKNFFQVCAALNEELYDIREKNNYWIDYREFESLKKNPELYKIFLSLLIEKYSSLQNLMDITHSQINQQAFTQQMGAAGNWLSRVLVAFNHFQSNQNQWLQNSANKEFSLVSYWTLFAEMMEEISKVTSLGRKNTVPVKEIEKVIENSKKVFEIYEQLQNKNYAASAFMTLEAVEQMMDNGKPNTYQTEIDFAHKLVSFLSDVVSAKNSQDLSKVIESNALPPASYRMRNAYKTVFDIGAYVGFYGGTEWVQLTSPDKRYSNPGFVYGITAPIGINFSQSRLRKEANGKSSYTYRTFSLTLIDIAAVVSYRIAEDADSPLPANISWSQVISPGFFMHKKWGLNKTPLVWSFGVQYAPKLRTINKESDKNTIRVSAGLALDLPLFMLHKGPSNK